jgi:hypothetical protein
MLILKKRPAVSGFSMTPVIPFGGFSRQLDTFQYQLPVFLDGRFPKGLQKSQ